MRKPGNYNLKVKATDFDNAIYLTKSYAKAKGKPSKVMADLMGVELKTYYRWMTDGTMPLNRVLQFEALAGCHFISEFLCIFHGNKIVIDIPTGKKVKTKDVASLQKLLAVTVSHLSDFYESNNKEVQVTLESLNQSLSALGFHQRNVQKAGFPELDFDGELNE